MVEEAKILMELFQNAGDDAKAMMIWWIVGRLGVHVIGAGGVLCGLVIAARFGRYALGHKQYCDRCQGRNE